MKRPWYRLPHWTPQASFSILSLTLVFSFFQNCSSFQRPDQVRSKKIVPYHFHSKPELVSVQIRPNSFDLSEQNYILVEASFNNPIRNVSLHRHDDCSDNAYSVDVKNLGLRQFITAPTKNTHRHDEKSTQFNFKIITLDGKSFCINHVHVAQNF